MACVSSSNNNSNMTPSSSSTIGVRTPFGSPPPKQKLPHHWNTAGNGSITKQVVVTTNNLKDSYDNLENGPAMINTTAVMIKAAAASMKSPITSCFERMLGAAQVLAQQEDVGTVFMSNNNSKVKSNEIIRPNRTGILKSNASNKSLSVSTSAPVAPATKPDILQSIQPSTTTTSKGDVVPSPKRTRHPNNHSKTINSPSEDVNPFQRIATNKTLYRRVVLAMALQKNIGKEKDENSNSDSLDEDNDDQGGSDSGKPPSLIISDGFFWKDYPPCEQILYEAMPTYYELSTQARQSKHQQKFNNDLVRQVRDMATTHGFSFSPSFTDKRLRDRIRCFFKTHLQNAKKRLCTMQKRNHLPEHQAALRAMLEAIESGNSLIPSFVGCNDMDDDERPRKLSRSI